MKKAFSFIKHGIIRREFEETLRQVHARGDVIQSWNGVVCMEHPLPGIGEFSVSSEKLIKAIEICEWQPTIKITDASVIVERGKVSIRVAIDSSPPDLKKQKGEKYDIPENFMESINLVRPFISEDASRNWACQVKVSDGYMYATNNIIIVRRKVDMPDCIIPIEVVSILQKLKDNPKTMVIGKSQIRFNYPNKAWLQGRLYSASWPKFKELFDKSPKKLHKLPTNMKEVINNLAIFCEDDILKVEKKVAFTSEAKIEGLDVPDSCASATHLKKVVEVFTHGDLSDNLFYFKNETMQGVMASMQG
jgi:hypothetical protein